MRVDPRFRQIMPRIHFLRHFQINRKLERGKAEYAINRNMSGPGNIQNKGLSVDGREAYVPIYRD